MQVSRTGPAAGVVCPQHPGGGAERQTLTSCSQDVFFFSTLNWCSTNSSPEGLWVCSLVPFQVPFWGLSWCRAITGLYWAAWVRLEGLGGGFSASSCFCLVVACLEHAPRCFLAVNWVSVDFWCSLCRKPKKEKAANKPVQAAEPLKRKKKGFLPETKKRKNRKKGVQENGVAPGGRKDGEPAAPEGQALGAGSPEQKQGPVPGSKKHKNRNRGVRENGVAAAGSKGGAVNGDAVADKKKKKRNRKRKGDAGNEAEQVPAAKKAKGSASQETPQKQGKAKKKRKEKKAPALQE